jgi:hypothetical protein
MERNKKTLPTEPQSGMNQKKNEEVAIRIERGFCIELPVQHDNVSEEFASALFADHATSLPLNAFICILQIAVW